MYFGEAFCGALPEHEALYPEILDYAYRVQKDDFGLAIAINTENAAEIRAAELAGFERIDQKETIMELSLDRDFSSKLPEGLQLREMDQIADREALEWLFWQGFDHGDDREAFERSLDPVPHVRRHFNKALCLSAAAPPESRYRTAPSGFILIRTTPMWSRFARSLVTAGKALPPRSFRKLFHAQKL